MNYSAELNQKMLIINDITKGDIRMNYMPHVPVNFNETGVVVLRFCNEGKSVDEIVDLLIEMCDLSANQRDNVKNDVLILLGNLWKTGVIRWKNGIFPGMEQYTEILDGATYREYTIEDSDYLEQIHDTFLADSLVIEKEDKRVTAELSMLTQNIKYYDYSDANHHVVIQTVYDGRTHQVNLRGVSFTGGEYDKEVLDKLIGWGIKRETANNAYIKNHFQSIPVYMLVNDSNLEQMLLKQEFENIGSLAGEVNMEDVGFFLRYFPV